MIGPHGKVSFEGMPQTWEQVFELFVADDGSVSSLSYQGMINSYRAMGVSIEQTTLKILDMQIRHMERHMPAKPRDGCYRSFDIYFGKFGTKA